MQFKFDPSKDKDNISRHGLSLAFAAFAGPNGRRSNTMSKTSAKRVIEMPSDEENARIVMAAKADPEAQPLTKTQLEAMVPMRALRGRPKSENKKLLLSVRYSPEVIAYFRGTGDGWQARMDGVLQEYVERQVSKRRGKPA